MRFEQLKKNSNVIVRKKLVKSKKNWIIVSSLSIVGGFMLLGSTTTDVSAATTTSTTIEKSVNTSPSALATQDSNNKKSTPASTNNSTTETLPATSTNTTNTSTTTAKTTSTVPTETTTGSTTDTPSSETNVNNSAPTNPTLNDSGQAGFTNWNFDKGNLSIDGGTLPEGTGKPDDTRWGGHSQDISSIQITSPVKAAKDSSYLFANMPKLTTISGLENLDTSSTTNMEGIFKNDTSLDSVDFSKNNVHSVKNFSKAFENDSKLKKVIFPSDSHANAALVNDTRHMFANDKSLIDPGVKDWQVHLLLFTAGMFKNDDQIPTFDIGGWLMNTSVNTGNSSIGEGMFDGINFQSIIFNNYAVFSPETALTSQRGNIWTSVEPAYTDGSVAHFSGIPNSSSDNGLGSLYKQTNTNLQNSKTFVTNNHLTKLTYNPTVDDSTTNIPNLITLPTNVGDQSFVAIGTVGITSSVDVPQTIIVDGHKYKTDTKTVTAKFGQTTATADQTVTYTNVKVAGGTVEIPTNNGSSVSLTVPDGNDGDTIDIDVPVDQIPKGYHSIPTKVTIKYSDDSSNHLLPDTKEIQISGDKAQGGPYTIPTSTANKTISVVIPNGVVGGSVTIKLPDKTGYKPVDNKGNEKTELTGTFDADGTFKPDQSIIYMGQPAKDTTVHFKLPNGNDITSTLPSNSKVGDKVTVKVPSVPGYVADDGTNQNITEVTGTIDNNGNFAPDKNITYTGKHLNSIKISDTKTDTNKVEVQSVDVKDNAAIKVGDKVTIAAPKITGYKPNIQQISGTLQADGTLADATNLTYTPIENKAITLTVKKPDGTTTQLTVPAGHYNEDTTGKIISPDEIKGYDKTSISYVYGADGTPILTDLQTNQTITSDQTLEYTAKTIPTKVISLPSNSQGNQTLKIPTGKVGTTSQLDVPSIPGYTAKKVKVNYLPDGPVVTDLNGKEISASNPIIYTGDPVPSQTISLPSSHGEKTITVPDGAVGDTLDTIALPDIPGYVTPKIKVHYTVDGPIILDSDNKQISQDHQLQYLGVDNPASTITIKNPDGTTTNITIPEGHYGDKDITITAPKIPGYNAPTLQVSFGKDGKPIITDSKKHQVTANEQISYTHISSGGHSSNTKPSTNNISNKLEQQNITIAIYSDQPAVKLYAFNNSTMSIVKNRKLASQSDWYSDESLTLDGIEYFRVATNEWVKASQVYIYQAIQRTIRTYPQANKILYKAEGTSISYREISANSDWYTDQIAYINGEKYYRVATNEFVKVNDAHLL